MSVSNNSLFEKNIWITGSARRVGKCIALHAAREGATIVIHYNHSKDEAAETLRVVQELSPKSIMVQGDHSNLNDVSRMVHEIGDQLGHLDALVNNASIFPSKKFEDVTAEDFDMNIDANLKGPFFTTQKALPLLRKKPGACVVNLIDSMVDSPSPNLSAYWCSKGGLHTVTKALARELAPQIRVNGVAPGPVMEPEDQDEEMRNRIIERLPMERWGTPDVIAEAVLFLIKNDFATGTILPIDGGRSLA